jgi:hypothetical protein
MKSSEPRGPTPPERPGAISPGAHSIPRFHTIQSPLPSAVFLDVTIMPLEQQRPRQPVVIES